MYRTSRSVWSEPLLSYVRRVSSGVSHSQVFLVASAHQCLCKEINCVQN